MSHEPMSCKQACAALALFYLCFIFMELNYTPHLFMLICFLFLILLELLGNCLGLEVPVLKTSAHLDLTDCVTFVRSIESHR